jgi:hypothetical protein
MPLAGRKREGTKQGKRKSKGNGKKSEMQSGTEEIIFCFITLEFVTWI